MKRVVRNDYTSLEDYWNALGLEEKTLYEVHVQSGCGYNNITQAFLFTSNLKKSNHDRNRIYISGSEESYHMLAYYSITILSKVMPLKINLKL